MNDPVSSSNPPLSRSAVLPRPVSRLPPPRTADPAANARPAEPEAPIEGRDRTQGLALPEVREAVPVVAPRAAGGIGKRARIVGAVLVGLALAGTSTAGVMAYGTESTDDAQIEGRVITLAPRVSGQVAAVLVRDNELVEAGQALVELDKADLEVKVLAARADLAAAQAGQSAARVQLAIVDATSAAAIDQAKGQMTVAASSLAGSSATVEQARADLAAASSKMKLAETELKRAVKLHSERSIADSDVEQRQSQFDVARATADLARARVGYAMAGIVGSQGTITSAKGRLAAARTAPQQVEAARATVELADARTAQAEAALELAKLSLSYATVRAPRGGVVSRRTVEVGQSVGPEKVLLAVVPTDDVWVVANFKEDQLARMKPGQAVTLTVDTFGRRKFSGHIESIANATGARFSLLPPDNATGNFVRVVQRVPVLVKLDRSLEVALRPGMSAYATVDVRH